MFLEGLFLKYQALLKKEMHVNYAHTLGIEKKIWIITFLKETLISSDTKCMKLYISTKDKNEKEKALTTCCGLNCVPRNSYTAVLTPQCDCFKEVLRVR